MLFAVATLAVAFRLISRMTILEGKLGWDDWTLFATYAFLAPCTALVHVCECRLSIKPPRNADRHLVVTNGLGQNIWAVQFDGITNILYVSRLTRPETRDI